AKPGTLSEIWPSLGSTDRHVRFAARIALEVLPVADWKDRALAETNATAGLQALLALARYGTAEDQLPLLQAVARWPLAGLPDEEFLTKLRVIEVSFARHGIPDAIRPRALEKLGAQFPATSVAKNRELVQLLVALDSPEVVAKALALRDAAPTQEEQMTYQVALRLAKSGWTPELRQRYFQWFNRPPSEDGGPTYPAGGNYFVARSVKHPPEFTQWFHDVGLEPGNGASFDNFLKNIRQEAFAKVPDAEKAPIAALIAGLPNPAPKKEPLRMLVKEWTTADLLPALGEVAKGRDFEHGKEMYREAQCGVCHRFQGAGGDGGPDLTGVGTRYSPTDVLKAITEPNTVISEQYQAVAFTLKNDSTVWGRLLGETPDAYEIMIDPLNRKTAKVLKVDVKDRAASPISPMPEGLLSSFQREEILDLLAYLLADGNPKAAAFKK
ncbi:MAG TPA: hypothetical protein DCE44_23790, partial [Verrucomicrobiales bacterium]|nr:hypothetical protein [Verrucomicrobiales bacterium]